MNPVNQYHSSPGKLLITGEYLILKGAEGFALPLKRGQSLSVTKVNNNDSTLIWEAFSPKGVWFSGTFSTSSFAVISASDKHFALRLMEILKAVRLLNPEFLTQGSYHVKTELDFNPEFGFGSSSTLIANLARWAAIDAFELQKLTFKGSGYDVAVALEAKPLIYAVKQDKPRYHTVTFNPDFAENIYFVYLGKKQRSLDAVKKFNETAVFTTSQIETVTAITHEVVKCKSLHKFELLLQEHETILSAILNTPPVGKRLFPDYSDGVVKSLGAWGGDFVLMTTKQKAKDFKKSLKSSGYEFVYAFNEIVKS